MCVCVCVCVCVCESGCVGLIDWLVVSITQVKSNLVTPRNGEPLIAAIQDFITGMPCFVVCCVYMCLYVCLCVYKARLILKIWLAICLKLCALIGMDDLNNDGWNVKPHPFCGKGECA